MKRFFFYPGKAVGGIDARQVCHQIRLMVHGKAALCWGCCFSVPVSCMATHAGETVEDRGFSRVGTADESNGKVRSFFVHKEKAPTERIFYKLSMLSRFGRCLPDSRQTETDPADIGWFLGRPEKGIWKRL